MKADFELGELKKFLRYEKINIKIKVDDFCDELIAVPNKDFKDGHEMVIRMGDFISSRTFAVKATKASKNINRNLINALKNDKSKGWVEIEGI